MNRTMKYLLFAVTMLVFMAIAFGSGAIVGIMSPFGYTRLSQLRPVPVDPVEAPENFNVFWQALGIVEDRFIDRDQIDPTELTYGSIRGMLQSLGDEGHTTFLTPQELKRQQTDIEGTFTGIGASIGVKDGLPVIIAPFDGSPAAQAGVKAGDLIIAVDGDDTSGEDLNDVVDKIRGPKGEEVTLTVLRIDEDETESLDITIVRDEIDIPAASWAMIPGTDVALLRLSQFNGNALRDLTQSIEEAKAAGATQLVLDLRNNPGGLLDQAVKVTSQFLKDGNVLQEEDADGNITLYPVEPGGVATDIPMVVLINPGSASSAEIMAGAIQDYERAPLVGETTFGTGTVLEPFSLEDGSALLLGTRQWLTAEGRLIRKHGIEPDVEVDLPISTDLIGPEALEEMTVDDLLNSEDAQLLKALELLDALPR
jgi:carboxyl-terminal processing protease